MSDEEAIAATKYAYLRHLDLKEFSALGALLTEDCTAAYDDGNLSYTGRDAIVSFLTDALGDAGLISQHHCHHPELRVAGDDAEGTWYLVDRVIVPAADLEIAGTAFYHDRYRKVSGRWLISHTGYARVFEEHRTHSTMALRSFRSRFDAPG